MLHLFAAAALLLQPPQAPPTFAQVAATHFAGWDRNTDGQLTADEIDRLCVDPAIVGEQAAAAAALKRIVRSGKYAVPTLTLAYLGTPPGKAAPAAAEAKDEGQQDRSDAGERAASPALKPPNFQASFASSLRKIRTAQRELFRDDTPDLDRCKQGPLGDCYFVAAVGAMVHRDGSSLKAMILPLPAGGYRVRFVDGRSIDLLPLTDAEVALSGSTGDEGLWLPVLEKALGAMRRQSDPKRYAMETATDAIAKGGSSATIIKLLTGHQTDRITLKKQPRSRKDADGKTVVPPPVPAGDLDQLAAEVRAKVGAALQQQRLVTCGTGSEKQPPGINGRHAYAVLAFDAGADTLLVWNPHGNNFRPRGEPGLQRGYATKAGMFSIPVADFVQVFRGLSLETDRPLQPPKPAAGAADGGKDDRLPDGGKKDGGMKDAAQKDREQPADNGPTGKQQRARPAGTDNGKVHAAAGNRATPVKGR